MNVANMYTAQLLRMTFDVLVSQCHHQGSFLLSLSPALDTMLEYIVAHSAICVSSELRLTR